MKKFFWKIYYRLKFKENYSEKISTATKIFQNMKDSTSGNLSHFYNTHGEQIRGWHKRNPKFVFSDENTLVTYYKNKG